MFMPIGCTYLTSLGLVGQLEPAAARYLTIDSIGRFPAPGAGNLPMEQEEEFHSAEGYAASSIDVACRDAYAIN
ncbi:MAG: hypothetical protein OHK0022_40930 [Roseiflexaceae bacterium]